MPDSLQDTYTIWTADLSAGQEGGEQASFEAMVDQLSEADVVFLGEEHTDSVTHVLERRILEALFQRTVSEQPRAVDTLKDGTIVREYVRHRRFVLAMEMFEVDVQLVLDEYLAGLIREEDFLTSARPWKNYATDYRPLVEFARRNPIPVVASNVPGRYAGLVAREGPAALDAVPEEANSWLPDQPLPGPSGTYAEAFLALMSEMEGHGTGNPSNMLAAQNLRDVTMANSIGRALSEHPDALIVHINGAFHSNRRMGIPDHLNPDTDFLVVTLVPSADLKSPPDDIGDYVVKTRSVESTAD